MSLAPRFTPPASLTPAVNDPPPALPPAQCSGPADDVLVVAGEPRVQLEVRGFDQVDELPSWETGVDVLEHGDDPGTFGDALVFPEILLQADERNRDRATLSRDAQGGMA